jgi:hypothetical protein
MWKPRAVPAKSFAHPTTIVNFVEGSRFTEEKRQQTRSPYQHLLPPKAAGIAMALNVLGHSSINC